jgi:hypothetical protein
METTTLAAVEKLVILNVFSKMVSDGNLWTTDGSFEIADTAIKPMSRVDSVLV